MTKEKIKDEVEREPGVDEMLSDVAGGKAFKDSDELEEAVKKKDSDDDDTKDSEEEKADEDDEAKKEDEDDEDKEESEEDEESKEEDEKDKEDDSKTDDDEDDEKAEDKDKKSELEIIKAQNEKLLETINSMLSPKEPEKKEKKEDEGEEEKEVDTSKPIQYVTDKDLEEAGMEDISADFLNKFANKIRVQTLKDSLKGTAKVVTKHVQERQRLTDIADKFYKKNDDLVNHKAFVGFRVNMLANKHPDWSYTKLFDEVGDDVREQLGLKKMAKKIEKDRQKKKPAFVKKTKTKGKGAEKETRTDTQKEIDDLI